MEIVTIAKEDLLNEIRRIMIEVLQENPITVEPHEKFLTKKEVCSLLSVSLSTVWRWMKDGKLTPHYVGGRVFFKQSEILKN